MRIYVASSWRNERQPEIVRALRAAGHEVYDFRNPHATGPDRGRMGIGFAWSEVDPDWKNWTAGPFLQALEHPVARGGFDSDMDALRWCDACVLVLPCGRSAHLEAGWAVGAGKLTVILLDDARPVEPELMYAMAFHAIDTAGLLATLSEAEHAR